MSSTIASYWVELLANETFILQGRYRTRVLRAGAGDPLVLLHGTGGHLENYVRNIKALSTEFSVVAIDLLWHGRSQTTGFNEEIIPPMVDQVLDVIDTLGFDRIHLEGQSLGGWVAVQFALKYPERVSKLVLTTPMGFTPDAGAIPGYEPRTNWDALRQSNLKTLCDPSRQNVRGRLERVVWNPNVVTEEAVAVRHALYNDPDLNAVQQSMMALYPDGSGIQKHAITTTMAASVLAPTLVYWGEKNDPPPAVGQYFAAVIPEGHFVCAPETGHWAQYESAEMHNREVKDFLLGKGHYGAGPGNEE